MLTFFNEQDIIELKKVKSSISKFFSLDPGTKCKGIVPRSAYEDLLAFLKLKRKYQVQSVSNDFHSLSFPYEEFPDPLEAGMFLSSTQPSAPPIPDSPVADSAGVGIKANMLADFEVHGEQVNFKGRGLVDMVYVPSLERVFHIHPSLIECQRNRTPKYASWAYTSLGRVLHFLENTKVEEMKEEACEWLQLLWDEVQVFGFDLSWLAPHVEFALNMRGYMEKMSKVNKLEEEKRCLELRIQELSMKLVEAEKEMESSKGDLEKNCGWSWMSW
ncbi:hypothetical protein SESBI_24194 [Sesbania bispinosa]|nr:hypothetical protein SESBI_24194 [Sesbania bispinosa]